MDPQPLPGSRATLSLSGRARLPDFQGADERWDSREACRPRAFLPTQLCPSSPGPRITHPSAPPTSNSHHISKPDSMHTSQMGLKSFQKLLKEGINLSPGPTPVSVGRRGRRKPSSFPPPLPRGSQGWEEAEGGGQV